MLWKQSEGGLETDLLSLAVGQGMRKEAAPNLPLWLWSMLVDSGGKLIQTDCCYTTELRSSGAEELKPIKKYQEFFVCSNTLHKIITNHSIFWRCIWHF